MIVVLGLSRPGWVTAGVSFRPGVTIAAASSARHWRAAVFPIPAASQADLMILPPAGFARKACAFWGSDRSHVCILRPRRSQRQTTEYRRHSEAMIGGLHPDTPSRSPMILADIGSTWSSGQVLCAVPAGYRLPMIGRTRPQAGSPHSRSNCAAYDDAPPDTGCRLKGGALWLTLTAAGARLRLMELMTNTRLSALMTSPSWAQATQAVARSWRTRQTKPWRQS